ncbi:MAG: class I SAM-dependent methyltransferase [Azospirillaceae bacterium]|nr:class I SAM-dependent methyltransferase [Azospirillaceae bacterium]
MSRLDSFIRRLIAQRDCLDWATREIATRSGPVLEIGLGNGRTYDHLRTRLPDRDIFVFERAVAAHPDCIPPADRLVLGDVTVTLRTIQLPAPAVLAHLDVGSGDEVANASLAAILSELLPPLLAPGALVLADRALCHANLRSRELPTTVARGRYFIFENKP